VTVGAIATAYIISMLYTQSRSLLFALQAFISEMNHRRQLFEYTEGRDFLPNGVGPKDILSQVINDASASNVDKTKYCNKLLRKAVFHGNYEIVQLVLNEAKDIGLYLCVSVCVKLLSMSTNGPQGSPVVGLQL